MANDNIFVGTSVDDAAHYISDAVQPGKIKDVRIAVRARAAVVLSRLIIPDTAVIVIPHLGKVC